MTQELLVFYRIAERTDRVTVEVLAVLPKMVNDTRQRGYIYYTTEADAILHLKEGGSAEVLMNRYEHSVSALILRKVWTLFAQSIQLWA